MKKTILTAVCAGAVILTGGLGYGGWYAWDQGLISGNKRAPTIEAMLPVVQRGTNLQVLQRQMASACASVDLNRPQPEVQGVPGIAPRTFPGQHAVTLLVETNPRDQSARERQIRQFSFLAKNGLFTESDLNVETDAGSRPAKQYRLTWKGFAESQQRGGASPCFGLGRREFNGITKIEKREESVLGMEVYSVEYETIAKNAPAWASMPEAGQLFNTVPVAISPSRETTRLMRGKEDWVTEAEAQMQAASLGAGTGGANMLKQIEEEIKSRTVPDNATIQAAFTEYLNGQDWSRRGGLACLPIRVQRGGEDREAAADRNTFSVTYYDATARQDYQRTQMINTLYVLAALEHAGFATRESPLLAAVPAPAAVAPQAAPARLPVSARVPAKAPSPPPPPVDGAKFNVVPEAVQALSLSDSACIPAGRMKVELMGTQANGVAGVQIVAFAKVSQAADWVIKLAEKLPALRSVIEDGIPITGTMNFAPDYRNGRAVASAKRWQIVSLNPAFPETLAASLPAELQPFFPLTTIASRKPVSAGIGGLPLLATGTSAATAIAPAPALVPGSNTPVAQPAVTQPQTRISGDSGKLPVIQGVATPFNAGALEVHVISVYGGHLAGGRQAGSHPEGGVIEVSLGKTKAPAMLLLSSYEPNEWRIKLEPGANLGKVAAYGHYVQRVSVTGRHSADIVTPSRESIRQYGGESTELPRKIDPNQLRDVAENVRYLTGKLPSTFQAVHRQDQAFVISESTAAFAVPALKSPATTGAGAVVLQGSRGDSVTALGVKYGNVGAYTAGWANRGYSSGKVYFEGYMAVAGALTSEPHANVGLAQSRHGSNSGPNFSDGIAVISHGQQKLYKNGDVFGIAVDFDAGIMYIRMNGQWITGEPGSGNGRAIKKGREYVPYFFASAIGSGDNRLGETSWTVNFGGSAFKQPVPSGFVSYDNSQKG